MLVWAVLGKIINFCIYERANKKSAPWPSQLHCLKNYWLLIGSQSVIRSVILILFTFLELTIARLQLHCIYTYFFNCTVLTCQQKISKFLCKWRQCCFLWVPPKIVRFTVPLDTQQVISKTNPQRQSIALELITKRQRTKQSLHPHPKIAQKMSYQTMTEKSKATTISHSLVAYEDISPENGECLCWDTHTPSHASNAQFAGCHATSESQNTDQRHRDLCSLWFNETWLYFVW